MPDFIYQIPENSLAIWASGLAIFSMILGLLIIKPVFRLLIGTGPDFNSSVNFATSSFSMFNGMLLGLLTVAAYQNSQDVRDSILTEATMLGGLYSQMNTYPDPVRSDAQFLMRDYALFTIHKEWPAHRNGEILSGGLNREDAIRRVLSRFKPVSDGEIVIHREVMDEFGEFSRARQTRLSGVTTEIPSVLWYAVLVGAAINITLLVLLKMRFLPHLVVGSITAFFLGVILFVIITLDRPLEGPSGLSPDPYLLLWERLMSWDEPVS